MRIEITTHQAEAIRADIIEINQLQDVLRTKMQHDKRMTDMIVRDHDLDPGKFQSYQLVEEKGKTFMELVAAPEPAPAAVPSAAAEPAQ